MSRKRIATSQDSTAILLPQEVLDEMGVHDGDEVDVAVSDRTLIMRPVADAERPRKSRKRRRLYLNAAAPPIRNLLKGLNSPCCS
jgi:antitoxin component of MazEF toxin-antitoxin module